MGRKNPNVSQILQSVHTAMISKYSLSGQVAQDIKQAKILTDFLQNIKLRAFQRKTSKGGRVGEDLYDLILDNISLPNGRTLHNLFTRTSSINKITGQYFEDDLAAVIAAVLNLANPDRKRQTYKNFSLGNVTGTTDINLLQEAEEYADDYVKDVAELTAKEIKKDQPSFVMGKIDTLVNEKIVNLNAEVDIPENLLEALSYASFTDKSYKSRGWDRTQHKEIDLGDRVIHLGNSNPYRAVLGAMSSLGFSKDDTLYVYYGGKNIVVGKDSDPPPEQPDFVKQHIYHLRYIYELTGAGILYRDYGSSLSQGAKFLVYNDPNSMEIICVSTSQIISQILNSTDFPDNPYGSIGIAKAAVRAMG